MFMRRILTAAALVALSTTAAMAAEIKVVTVGATRVALTALAADWQRATGNTVTYTFTNPANLAQTLAMGSFDAIVAPSPPMVELDMQGRFERGSRARVSRTGIGIAVREGAPKPDVSTPEKFRAAILAAKNVLYSDPATPNGSGVLTFAILTEAGLLDAVKAKGMQTNLAGVRELLPKGEYEMALSNMSEIEAPGVVIAGPVPAPLQRYTNYDTAVFANATDKANAASFMRFLASPAAAAQWRAAHLEQVTQ
jgi:molybdate transport system substrate-binding protein